MQSRPSVPELKRSLTTSKLDLLLQIAAKSEKDALKSYRGFMGNPNIGLMFYRNTLEEYEQSLVVTPNSQMTCSR